ncbi:hypothetical protein CLOHYLEM_04998 [[Clostridium] hylemonae DSM 15053]|uniref:Uncharacterized protein n=1 Tax=[Clostridium] hylemonae DSM 15053 TaxID=553973 RepID=C0BYV9_9FIRM|nr:hypothetical protein CLOHYLEM_04998 [[Clostridium] hylemonae DSM 15053]
MTTYLQRVTDGGTVIISVSVNGLARANQNDAHRVRVGATESNRYHMEHV